MATLHVLRVFCNERGEHGNELGVFLEGAEIPSERRQEIAAELGYSETVFVDNSARGEMRIFTPKVELDFAGHPTVGTAWLLREQGYQVEGLRPPAGEVGVRYDGELTYVAALAEWAPGFAPLRLPDPGEVDRLDGPPNDEDAVYAWAWIDEEAGTIRARGFAPGYGIEEDEATGSAALALCARLERDLTIRQGKGSILACRPLEPGKAEVGGRVVLDAEREYAL